MRITVLVLAAAVAGCGSPPDPGPHRGGDGEASQRGMTYAFGAATLYVSSGLIAPPAPPENIASALAIRVKSETNDCANVTQTGPVVDVELPGCTLASTGIVYSGTIHTTVSKTTEVLASSEYDFVVAGQP